MWHRLFLVCLWCALDALDTNRSAQTLLDKEMKYLDEVGYFITPKPEKDALSVGKVEISPQGEPLEDEEENQENIISQLLGDYDKVKTVSSGSDCVCRCIVRPIKRSDCSRLLGSDTTASHQHFYSVETVTMGTDCKKCECMAPPSAVNPCEGEYRFKKLQEASKDDIKMATIIDLLEGSLYGMDLLKLNSVTTKLLSRMDNIEKAFTKNLTEKREKDRAKEKAKERDKDKKAQQKKKKFLDLERPEAKSVASADKQKFNENGLKKNQESLKQKQQQTGNKTTTQQPIIGKVKPRQPIKDKSSMVVRGVTFYKAGEEIFKKNDEDEKRRGKALVTLNATVDLLITTPALNSENQNTSLNISMVPSPQPANPTSTNATLPLMISDQVPLPSPAFTKEANNKPLSRTDVSKTTKKPTPPQIPTTTKSPPTTIPSLPTERATTPQKPATTKAVTPPSTPVILDTTASPSSDAKTVPATGLYPTMVPQPKPKSRLSWTESVADQPKPTKKTGVCKDTVASISEPQQQNTYGSTSGAWMRDARGHGSVIYLTNGHYGNSLLEFRDMDIFKSGQASNSYKLPYSYTGTGHVVYNGAFYYNRAFSRDIIRYDLRHRFVAAWTTLHDALLEEQAQRTQTELEFDVDESGLWLLYPALDAEGFHQEVILLLQLHPRDLQTLRTFRTGLRRGFYGNCFLVCGVLYGVDSMERRHANVTYAFDTHTLTHTVPSLAFTNTHGYTTQLSYCPLDKKVYAWDDGHQMMYDVIFAY
ncbi:olfactomedin-like protein 2B [Gouania willdenowi]|uniref:olfactomedin-like protein 2B n=1 Tax=Gouania willdenowi TaxID=441366 RepID=UPI001055F389|nr:olfactomedin-like protein 2B [Gouania willdenowi]